MSRFNQPEKTVSIKGKIFAETHKAIRFHVEEVDDTKISPEDQKTLWFPISQLTQITRQPPESTAQDTIKAKEWIWNQKVEQDWKGEDPRSAGVDLDEDGFETDGDIPPW